MTELPPFRKCNLDVNTCTEGWAFYSERLGKEVGFYREHIAMDDQNIETDVNRYIAWPAQAR